MSQVILILYLVLSAYGLFLLYRGAKLKRLERLRVLDYLSLNYNSDTGINWKEVDHILNIIKTRYGKAGIFTAEQLKNFKQTIALITISGLILFSLLFYNVFGVVGLFYSAISTAYFSGVVYKFLLNQSEKKLHQEVNYYLPVVLEEIILLLESGLGLLPALERVTKEGTNKQKLNPVCFLLRLSYSLAQRGVSISKSFLMVSELVNIHLLKHTFLHLEVASTEGGELIPSLQSLSGHAHKEWKFAVESRVKKLENLVVFPVFISVIGLFLVTASVPLVPILEMKDQMKVNNQNIKNDVINKK